MPLATLPSRMTREQFIAAFAHVFEDSPWVAEDAWAAGISEDCDTPAGLANAMIRAVQAAGAAKQQALILCHPVLGTKQKISDYSSAEQKGAQLDQLSAAQADELQQLNNAYMKKFAMPFIMAVKGTDSVDIIAALKRRLQNDNPAAERSAALVQIYIIAAYRLEALWQS